MPQHHRLGGYLLTTLYSYNSPFSEWQLWDSTNCGSTSHPGETEHREMPSLEGLVVLPCPPTQLW